MSTPLFLSPQPFRAASSTAAGLMGLVPSPATGQQGYFLRGDATWVSAEAAALPNQTGASGRVLSSDGVNSFWATSIGPLTSSSITVSSPTLLATSVALTNGAAAATGTLTNAPVSGNPTKWIPINDNGTTRYIPCW